MNPRVNRICHAGRACAHRVVFQFVEGLPPSAWAYLTNPAATYTAAREQPAQLTHLGVGLLTLLPLALQCFLHGGVGDGMRRGSSISC